MVICRSIAAFSSGESERSTCSPGIWKSWAAAVPTAPIIAAANRAAAHRIAEPFGAAAGVKNFDWVSFNPAVMVPSLSANSATCRLRVIA